MSPIPIPFRRVPLDLVVCSALIPVAAISPCSPSLSETPGFNGNEGAGANPNNANLHFTVISGDGTKIANIPTCKQDKSDGVHAGQAASFSAARYIWRYSNEVNGVPENPTMMIDVSGRGSVAPLQRTALFSVFSGKRGWRSDLHTHNFLISGYKPVSGLDSCLEGNAGFLHGYHHIR